ncbi:hypothetical protein JTE90_024256 [Oedothorax gibbosus]|uniref:Methionine--tRNA ligase, cytoplasmic n=1 Tax=Oedothorax gibbosus TaxID=931172 RepID=A0AAV6VP30_9ARAC|nr:hypothetical protein JTE90_024256 [Oedothorax gibbosus]
MIKFYTDSACNIANLKIIATSEFYSTKVEAVTLTESKQYKTLPILEAVDGTTFFSSNASCRYLSSLGNVSASFEVDSWLEWEVSVLQPSVSLLLKATKEEAVPVSLKKNLTYLNAVLAKQQFLSGKENFNLADIVIWANLYPLFKASVLSEVSDLPNLQKWLTLLKDKEPLSKSFTCFAGDAKSENLKKKLVCNSSITPDDSRFFMPVEVSGLSFDSEVDKDSQDVSKEPDVTTEEIELAYQSWLKGKSALPPPKANKGPVLPKKGERNILITSALPYVNNIPHLGNIIGSVLSADVFARIAQDIFNKLYAQDLVLQDSVEQLFCESCQRFLADRFVEGTCPLCLYEDARGDQCDKCGKLINAAELKQPQCKICRSTPHLRSSKHLFLDLPKLEESLKQYLEKATSTGHWSNTAKVIANSWLKEGLKPRCITRDLKWGTPVPLEGFTDKVFYVWFDAPIGYLSITANYTDKWEEWWKQPGEVQLYQFMAKDNVPFHSIIFPACQIGSKDNYTIVNHLAATEYLNYEDVKFSKSRGIGVFGDDAKDTGLPSDIWRFYLLYLRPEAQDTYFSWSDLMLKINSELLNNLGNFINRALSFIGNNFGGSIPEMTLEDGEKLLIAQLDRELKSYIQCMEKTRLRDAIKYMLNISRMGNQYIQSNKPWERIKGSPAEKSRAGTVLGLSANICCLLCNLMEPYMPDTCSSLRAQLSSQPTQQVLGDSFVCFMPAGHKIGKPVPLFKKIEQDLIDELKKKYAGRQSPDKELVVSPAPKKTEEIKANTSNDVPNGLLSDDEIAKLEALVAEQGIKVRELKTNKAEKSAIDKEVAALLDLKKKLTLAKGETPEPPKSKSKNKKKR